LNLDDAFPARIRKAFREHKLIFGIMAPPPVVESTLTCLVPALNEVVVHIGSCRPDNLDIGVVPMALGVTRCSCGSGGQIDPADERHFGRLSCIDQPTLLVMEVVPARDPNEPGKLILSSEGGRDPQGSPRMWSPSTPTDIRDLVARK
jgi:hypothetical protein